MVSVIRQDNSLLVNRGFLRLWLGSTRRPHLFLMGRGGGRRPSHTLVHCKVPGITSGLLEVIGDRVGTGSTAPQVRHQLVENPLLGPCIATMTIASRATGADPPTRPTN